MNYNQEQIEIKKRISKIISTTLGDVWWAHDTAINIMDDLYDAGFTITLTKGE